MRLRYLNEQRPTWDLVAAFLKTDGRDWYLAGGTGLAIYLKHRDSEDLDLFIHEDFDPNQLADALERTGRFAATNLARNTLNGYIDSSKVQFLGVPSHNRLQPPQLVHGMPVADSDDIAAMKLAAIQGRAKLRDYSDLQLTEQQGLLTLDRAVAGYLARFEPRDPITTTGQLIMALGYLGDVDQDPFSPIKLEDATKFWAHRSQELMSQFSRHGLTEFAYPEDLPDLQGSTPGYLASLGQLGLGENPGPKHRRPRSLPVEGG